MYAFSWSEFRYHYCCLGTIPNNYSRWIACQERDFALFKMSKHTNLDIKDAACLHIVHNLQHSTYRPTTKSRQTTMVSASKQNFLPFPVSRSCNLTKCSTQQRPQANAGKSDLEAERVRAVGALRSLRSKTKLEAKKRREMHILSNE
jgi:hypothetical protein